MQKELLRLDEVQPLGLPAPRTLRNNLDTKSGLIRIGGDVPPLQTILVGGSRVIARAALQEWLARVAQIGRHAAPDAEADPPTPPRRRGRPRKAAGVTA